MVGVGWVGKNCEWGWEWEGEDQESGLGERAGREGNIGFIKLKTPHWAGLCVQLLILKTKVLSYDKSMIVLFDFDCKNTAFLEGGR